MKAAGAENFDAVVGTSRGELFLPIEDRILRRRAASFSASLLIHLAAIVVLFAGSTVPALVEAVGYRMVANVYVPFRAGQENPVEKLRGGGDGLVLPLPGEGILNLEGMQIAILEDPGYEMLKVLNRHDGLIGFGDPDVPRYLARLYKARDLADVHPGRPVPLDAFFAVALLDLEEWPQVAALRDRAGLGPEAQAFALFPPSFRTGIDARIREAAGKSGRSGRVTMAAIRFAASAPAGVIVESLEIET